MQSALGTKDKRGEKVGGSGRAERQLGLDRKLITWIKAREPEDEPEWDVNDLEISFEVWKLLEQTGWEHLPCEGGLLDQPAWLFEDLLVISWRKGRVEEMMKAAPKQRMRE